MKVAMGIEVEFAEAEVVVTYEVAPGPRPRFGSPFAMVVFPDGGGEAEVYDVDGDPIEGYAYDEIVADATERVAVAVSRRRPA